MPAQGHLLAGYLGMEIQQDYRGDIFYLLMHLVEHRERTIYRVHENPSLQVYHSNLDRWFPVDDIPRPGTRFGVVRRTKNIGKLIECLLVILLVPDVIP